MRSTRDVEVPGAGGSATVAPAEAGDTPVARGSRARRIAFRVVAVLTSLWVLVLGIFPLMWVVLMWLPWDTLMSCCEVVASDEIHRGHWNIGAIVWWALVPAVLVQLRKPERRVAAMQLAVGIVVAGTVVFGLSGTLAEWLVEEITLLVPVLLLALLHPRARDLVRCPRTDRTMGVLVGVAAVPWLVFTFDHALLQWHNVTGDPHAELEHWGIAAQLAVVILWGGLVGSSDNSGWRLPAWIAALASIEYGAHSLVFPDLASAASSFWAVAAIAWGAAFAVAIVGRSRRDTPAGSPSVAAGDVEPVA